MSLFPKIHVVHHFDPETLSLLRGIYRKLDSVQETIMIDTTKILAAVARERTENASLRALLDAKDKIITDSAAALKAAIDAGGDPVALAKIQADLDQAATDLDTDSDATEAAINANTPPPAAPTT